MKTTLSLHMLQGRALLAALAIGSLAGCVSRPLVFVDPFGAGGSKQFGPGEAPTLYYSVNPAVEQDIELRIRRVSDGAIVGRSHVGHVAVRATTTDFDLSQPPPANSPNRVSFPRLAQGDYVAELWLHGELKDSCAFSVRG